MPFPLSESELQKTEAEIGAAFPQSYRLAMMQSNGGTVETESDDWALFPIQDQSSRKHLSRTCCHILYETEQAREWRTFPEHAYAIGGNGTGDLLVLLRKEKKFGNEVFVWSHEDGSLLLLASDFAELSLV